MIKRKIFEVLSVSALGVVLMASMSVSASASEVSRGGSLVKSKYET